MAIALVGSPTTQVNVAGSSTTAPSITRTGVQAGSCLIPVASVYDANTSFSLNNVTDGVNTYTAHSATATRAGELDRSIAAIAYALNVSAGDYTVAFNLSGTSVGSNRYYVLGLYEFSGVATSAAEDDWDENSDIDSSGATDANAGPIDTTEAGDLIIGVSTINVTDSNLNLASPTNWTNAYRQNNQSTHIGMDSGYWLPGSTQSNYTAQWAHDNAANGRSGAIVMALKAATAAGNGAGSLTNSRRLKSMVGGGLVCAPMLGSVAYQRMRAQWLRRACRPLLAAA